jgi:CO/xanthine dehydrogenase FAD-binding subunit
MPTSFRYAQPRQLAEAFEILDSHGPEASVLAGGTDLVVGLRKGQIAPHVIVDLKKLTDLSRGIELEAGRVSISAPTPLTDIIADHGIQEHFPALVQAAQTVGSVQIRNRATLAGNICNASPAADTAPALLAYGASVVLVSRLGFRVVLLEEFLLGPRAALCRSAGESVGAVAARITHFAASLGHADGVDLVVGITHSPVLRAVVSHYAGTDPGEPDYLSGYRLCAEGDGSLALSSVHRSNTT